MSFPARPHEHSECYESLINTMEIHDIEKELTKLPNLIWEQNEKVITAREGMENAKLALDRQMAIVMLASDRSNATEKKAQAIKNTENESTYLLQKKIEYEREINKLECLNNKFNAVRKLASLALEQMPSRGTGN